MQNKKYFVKLWHVHEICASFSCFALISQNFEQIFKYFEQSESCDCMSAVFRNFAEYVNKYYLAKTKIYEPH